jgi:hypothetical protein
MMTPYQAPFWTANPVAVLVKPELGAPEFAGDTRRAVMQALALPFDALRAQYVRAVTIGLIEPSMLAQRDFERALGATERLVLGPWARQR